MVADLAYKGGRPWRRWVACRCDSYIAEVLEQLSVP
jgi:hypothetical protein